MNYWSLTKTTLALVSIGILLTPALRRLGYLPPATTSEPLPAPRATTRAKASRATAAELSAAMPPQQTNGKGRSSHH